jgi:hypothetical protein
MIAFLIFIALPVLLIVASFFIKPLVRREDRPSDVFGAGLFSKGAFGGTPEPERAQGKEETEPVRFRLEEKKE